MKGMKKKYFLLIVFVLFSTLIFAQDKESASIIVENYDLEKIKQKQNEFKNKQRAQKKKALEIAKQFNWPEFVKGDNGRIEELMKVTPDGFPVYYSNNNADAAKSTRVNHLNTGGSLGLNLNGQGMVARVWDGGTVRRTHNYLTGRITTVDDEFGTSYIDHATHVTGTIIASNTNSLTKGMAYQGSARTFNWTDDESEALSEVQGGMVLSNHSYGVPVTSGTGVTLPSWYIGAYDQDAKDWDEIAYLSPYYLAVVSAGNDGNNQNNTEPMAFGFDKLTGNKNCKNNLVVANAQDAVVDANGNLTAELLINSSSSQGPSDDRRIKPDITGNGTGLRSTVSTSNTSTGVLSGTSMAAPNVTGTLLLVQQHNKNVTNNFMKAATLKGIACHTADDAGSIGPDPIFGWGLLNGKKAVETINGNGTNSWISEQTLNQGQSFTMNVKSDGINPLIASITWTDLPGNPGTGIVNDLTPKLINDLDIRITRNSSTYYPWKLGLDPNEPATRITDNNVDNVEAIKIDAPTAGDYTITITHKGNLVGSKQDYSLIVTGLTSNFGITSTSNDLIQCSDQNAVYTFNYKHGSGPATNFSIVGLPAGALASLSPTSLSANGTVTMTITGLSNVQPNQYNIGILGNNGVETETRYKTLTVYNANFQAVSLSTPSNGQTGLATSLSLKWVKNQNAENYNVQVSTDASFTNIIANVIVTSDSYQLVGLNQETYYYWRVIPSNRCGNASANSATVRSFQTGVLVCGYNFTATDFSNANIPDTANAVANVPLTISGGHTIGDLDVNINISHTFIQDMTVSLIGPASIGSPVIDLLKEVCGNNDDINCVIDDSGLSPACTSAIPALTGSVMPSEALSDLNGLVADGVWTLHVEDPYNGDGGVINSFGINICKVSPSLSIKENELAGVKVYPNPTNGDITIDLGNNILEGEINFLLTDIQGRQIMTKKLNGVINVLNLNKFSNGVYFLSVENGNKKTIKKIVLNK